MRLTLFGDGRWAAVTLDRLLRAGHNVASVVLRNRPTDEELTLSARRHDIPVLQPRNVNDEDALQSLRALKADLNVSIAYDQILRSPAIRTAARGTINVHGGKLPNYRGRNILNWAIINGETEVGITVHEMDEGIDTGPILSQVVIPVAWNDTYGDVLENVVRKVPPLLIDTLERIERGTVKPRPQPTGQGFYCRARRDGDEWLEWSWPSGRLHNFIRGITRPAPGARTLLDGRTVVIWSAHYEPSWPRYSGRPGTVLEQRPDGALVKTLDSAIHLREVQQGGKAMVPRWRVGTVLESPATPVAAPMSPEARP